MPDLLAPKQYSIGDIIEWSGLLTDVPYEWALCDGGTHNGIVTPDLHGKFLRGAPAGNEAGSTGGEDSHVLTTAEMPAHNHSFSNTGHTHSVSHVGTAFGASSSFNTGDQTTVTSSSNSSGITVGNKGSGTAHENRPAYLELAYIMKVK